MIRKSKKRAATIRDVAMESGFSPATVSIVLNEAPLSRYIQPSTKDRIRKAARKLGYRPNELARSLRSKRTRSIGLIVFDVADPFCTSVLGSVESTLYRSSYLAMLADAHNELSRFESCLEMLLERRVEGIIVVANWMLVDINLLADLRRRNVPTVVIGREMKHASLNSISVDNELGARIALEHLYTLRHRKIAFVRGPRMMLDSLERWRGVTDYAASVGLRIDPKLVIELPSKKESISGYEGGYNAIQELLRRKKAFTAIMAFDDMAALGTIRALLERGIKVPEECSVIGFDDIVQAAISIPSLTTVRQPMEVMGATAVEIIVSMLQSDENHGRLPGSDRKLAPELIVRDSTARL